MKGLAEGLGASSVLATSKGNSRARSQRQKGKPCPMWRVDAADLYRVQRLAEPPPRRGAKGLGGGRAILLRSTPNLRTGGDPDAWKARWLAEPRAARTARGGDCGARFRGPGGLGPFPEIRERATCSPRPSHPRILFLLSHGGRRAMQPDRPRVKPRRPGEPAAPGPRTRARAAPSPTRPPSSVPLTQRPSRPPF